MRSQCIAAALLFLSTLTASAASKLDARLQLLKRVSPPVLTTQGTAAAPAPQITFLLVLNPGATKQALAAAHPSVAFTSQLGSVVTAAGPLSALAELEADPDVISIEADRRAHPANDVIRSSSTSGGLLLGSLKTGLVDLGSLDGTGVVIGVVDTGIDWTHPDFVDAGASRILSIWNQNDAVGPAPSANPAALAFFTGTEWLKTGVNGFDANLGNASCTAVGGGGCPIRQLDTNGHGTNVAGIAGGNGTATGGIDAPNFYSGLAPKAQFIIVNTDFTNSGILQGINYLVAAAAAYAPGKKLLVNLSLGENSGPHDGTDAFESAVNAAALTTPILVAMGNDQLGNPHADTSIGIGGSATFAVNNVGTPVDPFGASKTKQSCLNTEFWHPGTDHYNVTVSLTCSGSCPAPISAAFGASNQTTVNGVTITIQNDQAGNGAGDSQVFVQVEDHGDINCNSTGGKIVTNFSVQFNNTALGSTGRVDAYTDPELTGTQFTSLVDANGTLTEPAAAPNAISVAAYSSKKCWPASGGPSPFCDNAVALGNIASFSGRGPTRTNIQKPDIAAPGEYVVSSKSKDYAVGYPNIIPDGTHTDFHGTSQATPAVAGAVALRLQVNPALTPAQLKAALRADGRTDAQTAGVPNFTWGYGKMLAPPLIQAAPGAFTVTGVGVSTIGYSWTLAANATSYNLYPAGAPNSFLASVVSPLQYTLASAPNTQSTLNVCGVNGTGRGPCATSLSTVTLPSPIPGLPTYQVSVSSILVNYSACPATTCSGYIFQAATNANFTGTVFSTSTNNPALLQLQFPPGTLTAATPYFMRVGSLNSVSASSMTALGSTTTLTNILVPGVAAQGPIAATSIQFNWSSGGNSGGTIYSANVSSVANFGSGTTFNQTGVDLFSGIFNGLLVNTSYYLRVNALLGPVLSSGPVSTLALAPVSSVPNFANITINGLRVQWPAGPNPSGTQYIANLSASPAFIPLVGSSQTMNLFADFAGLNPNATYYAEVAAIGNAGGVTAFTNLGPVSTLAQPLTPAAVSFTNAFNTGFTANFLNPSNPPGTLFAAQVSTSADFTTVAASSLTFNTFATFSGLIPNQTYYLSAAALNNNGVLSSTAAFFNPAAISTVALPSAPVVVAPAGSTQTTTSLFANWGAGGNARPSLFKAEAANNAQFTGAASSTTYSLQAGFTGLTTNTSYYLRVRTLDNDSSSLASAPTALGFASTLPNAPGVPGFPFVSVTFASVTVNWTGLPAGPPTATCEGYRVQASVDPGFGSIAATSDFPFAAPTGGVAGLSASTNYFVRVGAIGFDGAANFTVLGSTLTAPLIISSAAVGPNGASITLPLAAGSTLSTIQVYVPPGVLPLGAAVSVSPSVATLPPPNSNEAKLTVIGGGTAFDINAGGLQPNGLVKVTLNYNRASLSPGIDPRTIQVARYDPGSSQWTLQQSFVDVADNYVVAQVGHFSLFSPFAVTPAEDLDSVNIFPIPWEPTSPNPLFNGPFLTISNLPMNARVRIFTISGEKVWEGGSGATGILTWPGNNSYGRIVGSGTYLVVIDGAGKRITRRAVIAR